MTDLTKYKSGPESIEILFGWLLLGIAAFLQLSYKMDFNEKITIFIPAVFAVALFKVLFDSVSSKLIRTDNLVISNLFSLFCAIAIVAGLAFIYIQKTVQLPPFLATRFTLLCAVFYTCLIYFSGKRFNIPRQRFYGYFTLILLIILNFRMFEPLNKAIVLLVTIGFTNIILPILSIIKSKNI